jgi:hypothetical protein
MSIKAPVLVIHADGSVSHAKKERARIAVENGVAYFSDRAETKLIMLKSTDDTPINPGYEYGGKKSYAGRLTARACDRRTRTEYDVPIEYRDRTQTPVREAGGAKTFQLKPLVDKRSSGRHITMPEDKLWRPSRKRTKPQAETRA